jgi:hypothetical protein
MPGPFIFIATNRLREGRFHAEQQRVPSKAAALGTVSWAKWSGVVDVVLLPDRPM